MVKKQWNVDFENWIVTADTEEEVNKKIEERLCDGEIPKVSSIEEIYFD